MPASCRPTMISRPTKNSFRCSPATSLSHMPTPRHSSRTSDSSLAHRLGMDLGGSRSGMDGIMHSNCAFLQHGLQIMSENSLNLLH